MENWITPALLEQPLWKIAWHFHVKLKLGLHVTQQAALLGFCHSGREARTIVRSSCVCSGPKLESTRYPSVVNKQTVPHPYHGVTLSNGRDELLVHTHTILGEPQGNDAA